ncbi:MAG TPA: hypothetical protein VMJ93_18220 [Verrucomicrobiae bacterium]|nr:hypothetical protein [Verrucomicrobiae bacterium]
MGVIESPFHELSKIHAGPPPEGAGVAAAPGLSEQAREEEDGKPGTIERILYVVYL